MFWSYCDWRRDMDTPLRPTQSARGKDLEETKRKDINPTTSHRIGWQDHDAHFFLDCEGVLLVDFLPHGTTVNSPYYASLLHQLHSSIREKHLEKLIRGMLLLHENALVHKSNITQAAIHYTGFTKLNHPVYSSVFAPSDYYLISQLNLKSFLLKRSSGKTRQSLI